MDEYNDYNANNGDDYDAQDVEWLQDVGVTGTGGGDNQQDDFMMGEQPGDLRGPKGRRGKEVPDMGGGGVGGVPFKRRRKGLRRMMRKKLADDRAEATENRIARESQEPELRDRNQEIRLALQKKRERREARQMR